MKGKLIIIEAGDGSGKATQTQQLYSRLSAEGYKVRKVSFPNYDKQSSALIKMYLNGEFGSTPDAVNAYAASTFYAVDRYASYKNDWGEFYNNGGIIIADRYTTSNMVHQAVKIKDTKEKDAFLDWLWDLEFNKFALPVPDAVVFLDMPPEYSQELRRKRALKNGETLPDIHESNEQYLNCCYTNYCIICEKYNWHRINCVSPEGLKNVEEIHNEVYKVIMTTLK